jgi:hypothetical protein
MQVTVVQAMTSAVLCHNLSNTYREISVFRFDPLTGDICILAGEDMGIVIKPDGNWKFEL